MKHKHYYQVNASVWFVAVCTALKSGLKQHNHYGFTRFGHCPARPTYPLCSDEERVSYSGESDHFQKVVLNKLEPVSK